MAKTRAQENRAIRQEALREQLANQGHVEEIVDITKKLSEPSIEPKDIQRLKVKADIHLALIKKYIPDVKAVEHSGNIEHEHQHTVKTATNEFLSTFAEIEQSDSPEQPNNVH